MTSSRTGFTKIGFTKSGFGCCGHFAFCDMGKTSCFYEESDPEAKEYCAAYIRNHSAVVASPVAKNTDVPINMPPVVEVTEVKCKVENTEDSGGQLSLF